VTRERGALAGRVALVTGGSGGIGRALCGRLADAGAAVAVAYGRGAAAAESVARSIVERGGRGAAVEGDLQDPAEVVRLVDRAERELGPVDILVANAGRGQRATLDDLSVEEWDRTMRINLRAPFLLAQRVAPGMRERGFGRILFTSSVAAFTGGIVGPHYAASKAGLHGLTHFLASRLAEFGITVNAIAPALIEETGMLPGGPELTKRIPVGRLGRPEEVADLALTILVNGYVTNQVVSIDGGMYAR
jgi:3-oxoacyl-[acyl-carrier protein] reductase